MPSEYSKTVARALILKLATKLKDVEKRIELSKEEQAFIRHLNQCADAKKKLNLTQEQSC